MIVFNHETTKTASRSTEPLPADRTPTREELEAERAELDALDTRQMSDEERNRHNMAGMMNCFLLKQLRD